MNELLYVLLNWISLLLFYFRNVNSLFSLFTVWLQSQVDNSLVNDRQTVPFLPVNPEFSSTRNQGRQKLARFNAREFATLIIDILSDAKRRQQGISTPASSASTPSREKGK